MDDAIYAVNRDRYGNLTAPFNKKKLWMEEKMFL
jgi:hypothetical protein